MLAKGYTAPVFRTLLLGPSTITFTEPGQSAATPDLLRSRLPQLDPGGEHEIEVGRLFFGDRMAEFASQRVREFHPECVVAVISTSSFEEDFIVNTIKRRWPRLYAIALEVSQRLKIAAGGGLDGSTGVQGLLLRLPRSVAHHLIGAEPTYPFEAALAESKATVDALARFEDLSVAVVLAPICRSTPNRVASARVHAFKAELAGHCRDHHVTFIERFDYCRRLAVTPAASADGIHAAQATREADATAIAELILEFAAGTDHAASAADTAGLIV